MKKILMFVLMVLSFAVNSKELIIIYSPYSPGHSGNVAFEEVLNNANISQSKYNFILEMRPGAQGVIALKRMDEDPVNRLGIIYAAHVDNIETGLINEKDYVPIHGIGDACWAVTSLNGNEAEGIASLKGTGNLVVGTVGAGNVTHLTALSIAKKYKLETLLVLYKSNFDAVIQMVGNHGVNFTIDRYSVIQQYKVSNPNIKILGMSCPTRYSLAPNIKTLKEQGFDTPVVFDIVVANKKMPKEKQLEFTEIFAKSTKAVGLEKLINISDMRSPVFDNIPVDRYYSARIEFIKNLRLQFKEEIAKSKN